MEGANREKTLIIKEDLKTTKDMRAGVHRCASPGVYEKHFFVDMICTFIYNLFVTVLLSISCSMFVHDLIAREKCKILAFCISQNSCVLKLYAYIW